MTDFTPEQILAALHEATQPDSVTDRWERGYAWATQSARRVINQTYIPGNPEATNLEAIEKALRVWLAEGPDYDSHDYVEGCEAGQQIIRDILDGDVGEVCSYLEDARDRARRIYDAATEGC